MKKSIALQFLTFFCFVIGHSQSTDKIDSLKMVLDRTNNDSVKIKVYDKLRRATVSNDPIASENYTALMLQIAKKIQDSTSMAFANYYLGNANVTAGDFEKALEYYFEAADHFERKEDFGRLSGVLNGIAAAYENNGNDSLSLKYFERSLEISRNLGDKKRTGIALNNIANIFSKRGELNIAIAHLEEALVNLQDPSSAYYYMSLSLNLADAYSKAGRYKEAKKVFGQVLPKIDTVADVYNHALALRGLGRIALEEENSADGALYLERAVKKFSSNHFEFERFETLIDLVDAYYDNNDFKQAMDLYYEYNVIKDSIFNSEKNKNLTDALQKYQSEKKEREIAEQKLVIEQKELQKNQILLGLGMLGILLVGTFIFFKKRMTYQKKITAQAEELQNQKITELQQRNKLLSLNSMIEGQEAERLRIAKDLHDSLGGLLSTVKNHFSTIQNQIQALEKLNLTEKTGALIDEACIEVRRISHNMVPHALSISGLQGAIEDLAEQLNGEGYGTTVEFAGKFDTLEDTKKVMIFRLVQEIISNIRKHAQAKNILIQILDHQKELKLIVEDDGQGFLYEEALTKGGLGLKSINSRVEFLDGDIDWDSELGKGTTISISIPL